MCKKQKSVSHSSTESEIISLDTGLRMDGLPALELWDLIVSVFGNIYHVSDGTGQPVNGKNKSYNKIDVVHDIDLVPSNVQSATTPTTSPSPSQVMSPTTRSSTSSLTPRVLSPTLPRHRTRTWMT